jgi:membrane-bound lytic murein transglycosylase B
VTLTFLCSRAALCNAAFALFLIAACATTTGASTLKHSKSSAKASATTAKAGEARKTRRTAIASGPLYATRPDAMEAAEALALRRNLDPAWVRKVVGQAHYMPSIAKAISPPPVGVPKNWTVYRRRFIDAHRIKAGVKFWQANQDTLARAELEMGVPAAIIVGIIGVETIYGEQTGNYRVMDALCTLAFDFPAIHPKAQARAAFFLSELESFLALTQRTGTDPLALKGSYAGAMGLPQFMPSSWDQYAIDFDGDGRVDLFYSTADVIGSVANYFKAFKWRPGMPTHYPVQFDDATLNLPSLLGPDILPTFTPAAFVAKGGLLDSAALQHNGPLALVALQNGDAPPLYLAGTENFYAITRYNWSSYYALAVIELGQAVQSSMPK